ncbi:hypothetical protein [Leptolyngbya sp. CCY15150]|uniref:hypothetical protein n=1 Tax=Leptolyngbya sp. CCY15150 TaxID=2767772 RepID=UPI00195050F5|nr:hypothetical protein [Leptolyngbya sp. CCY15150]
MPPIVYRLLPAGWLWRDEGRRSLSVGHDDGATTFRSTHGLLSAQGAAPRSIACGQSIVVGMMVGMMMVASGAWL